jgi:hypothetical protein
MTILKRNKREERPLLLTQDVQPVLSDQFLEGTPKKNKWKLFAKKKTSGQSYETKEEMKAWEPVPPLPSFPPSQAKHQTKIQDNATTQRALKQRAVPRPPPIKTSSTPSPAPVKKKRTVPLPKVSAVLAKPFGRESLLLKDCMVRFIIIIIIIIITIKLLRIERDQGNVKIFIDIRL